MDSRSVTEVDETGSLNEKASNKAYASSDKNSTEKKAGIYEDTYDDSELEVDGKLWAYRQLGLSDEAAQYLVARQDEMSSEEAHDILTNALVEFRTDRNFDSNTYAHIEKLLSEEPDLDYLAQFDREFEIKKEATLIHHFSPYTDVRAITDPFDKEQNVETFRAYILGTIWVIVGSGVNQFFYPRQPPLSLDASLFQLLVLPCGWFWAYVMPSWDVKIKGYGFNLNPGPWAQKEQLLVTLMFNVTQVIAYINSQIFVQKLPVFYGQKWVTAGYQITLMIGTQFLGFSLAGLARSILVYPTKNLWMTNFPVLALNRSLMSNDKGVPANGWKIARYSFFGIVFAIEFFYQWIPSYLMTFLSNFNWLTWIAPNNYNLATITGSMGGLGINPIPTFDWTIISYNTPLVTPFYSQSVQMIGIILTGAVLIPAVYYSNMYNTAYLPPNDNSLYDNKAQIYDVNQILSGNSRFDAEKYQKYSPPFYTAANLVVYGSFFAAYTCLIVRSLLYEWKLIYEGYVEVFHLVLGRGEGIMKRTDAQARLMQKYKEVPLFWYIIILLIALACSIVSVECWPTETPVWGIFFALAVGVVFLVPAGMLYSQTNVLITLNVLTELVAGYALPGRGIAMMIIKAFGVNVHYQAISFLSDLKLCHYGKVSPRAAFRAQVWATLISGFVVIGVANYQISNIDNICTNKLINSSRFTCPEEKTYFAASVIWGVIGPKRVFDSLYPVLKWCFLIGAVIPIPYFLLDRFVPGADRWTYMFDPIIIIYGMLNYYAPFNLTYALMGWYLSFIFMHYIKKRYTAWFNKYNYVLSAALSAGSALSLVIIFFSVQYNPKELNWWGNLQPYSGIDGAYGARADGSYLKELPAKGYFGPDPGTYDV